MSLQKFDNQYALVTGASGGFGLALARDLAPRVGRLRLIARDSSRLAAAADSLRELASGGCRIETRSADLGDAGIVRAEAAEIERDPPGILINNAAAGEMGPFGELDPDHAVRLVTLNALAPLLFARSSLPSMLAAGRGWILNVSSIITSLPSASVAVYASTKGFVDVLGQCLASEVLGSGVVVTTVRPGPMETGFSKAMLRGGGVSKAFGTGLLVVPVERVARIALSALASGRAEVVPGVWPWLASCVGASLPRSIRARVLLRMSRARGALPDAIRSR